MTERRITDRPMDAAGVVYWLERAGITLQALPDYSPRLDVPLMSLELRMAAEMARREAGRARPSIGAGDIDAMDTALGWLQLIENRVRRKIVAVRSIVRPLTGRYLYTMAEIGKIVGADRKTIGAWYDRGIAEIVEALNREDLRRAA